MLKELIRYDFTDNFLLIQDCFYKCSFGYLNPINYIWDKLQPEWFKEMEFRTKEDFQTYRNRLESYGDQLDDMIELMREAMRLNRTNHNASMVS